MKIAAFYENIIEATKQENITLETCLKRLYDKGLHSVCFSFENLAKDEETILNLLKSIGLKVESVYHFFDYGNKFEKDGYIELIDTAKRVQAENVLIVPGMASTKDEGLREQQARNMLEAMKKIVAYGSEKAITVTMEDFDSVEAPYCTIKGLKWFLDEVEGLKCAFDTGNFIVYDEDEFEAYKQIKNKIISLHLKDRALEKKGKENQAFISVHQRPYYPSAVGYGDMQIKKILDDLMNDDFQGNGIVELFGSQEMMNNLEKSIEWLKQEGYAD